ncbi:hypothetical protein IMY05_015G0075800 [Salix suchowensis]|nr:hypothetical protein IMY05_015G0075800 [Salix suchowensis]
MEAKPEEYKKPLLSYRSLNFEGVPSSSQCYTGMFYGGLSAERGIMPSVCLDKLLNPIYHPDIRIQSKDLEARKYCLGQPINVN